MKNANKNDHIGKIFSSNNYKNKGSSYSRAFGIKIEFIIKLNF